MVRPPCLISVLPCKAILVTRAAALKVGMGSVVPVDMDWIPRSIYKDVWFICDYPSADNYLIYLVLRWQRFDRVAMALENSHIAGEPGRKQLVTQAWENVFSYTEHFRCISNINTYGTFASTCVYYIWKAQEIWDIIVLAPIQTSQAISGTKKCYYPLPDFFFLHIYLPVWCSDAQSDAGFVGGCTRDPFSHSTLNNLRLEKIDPTNEAHATGGVDPWMLLDPAFGPF